MLTAENGLVRYVYPLNTEKFSIKPLEEVSVRVEIKTKQPIRAVYSPTHSVDITRQGETNALAGWEAKDVKPDSDFALYYSIGESEAFHFSPIAIQATRPILRAFSSSCWLLNRKLI